MICYAVFGAVILGSRWDFVSEEVIWRVFTVACHIFTAGSCSNLQTNYGDVRRMCLHYVRPDRALLEVSGWKTSQENISLSEGISVAGRIAVWEWSLLIGVKGSEV
jgi:hypothetical protein